MANARILVADDDELVRAVMRSLLSRLGYSIVEAVDGEDAVRKCLAEPFDLLLMDQNMPRVSGRDACAEIRRQRPGTKVLMLSGLPDELNSADAAVKFLGKPFHNHELVSAVGEMLRQQP